MEHIVLLFFTSLTKSVVSNLFKKADSSIAQSNSDNYSSTLNGSGKNNIYHIVTGDNSPITINLEKMESDVGDKKT